MPVYAYKAKNIEGELAHGTLTAENSRAALEAVSRLGVYPLEIREKVLKEVSAKEGAPRISLGRIGPDEIALFTRQLADLLKAGVSINRALMTLAEHTPRRALAEIIKKVAEEVTAGKTLQEATAAHPKVFSRLTVAMVRAGETGGFLDESLRRVAHFYEREAELRSRIRTALAYPALLSVLGLASVGFLLVFFIPRFSSIFQQFGGNLPLVTKIIVGTGEFMTKGWPFVLVGLIGIIAGGRAFVRTETGRLFLDRMQSRAPLLGTIVIKNRVSRFVRTLGALLHGGVPIVQALQIARESLASPSAETAMNEVVSGVRQGKSLAELLRQTGFMPAVATDMIAIGEETGNLSEVLSSVAESYDRDVDRAVRVFVTLFEPLLLMVMAALVGVIVVGMLLPVFTLSGMIR